MPEKPKKSNDKETEAENVPENDCEIGGDASSSKDEKKKSYYYDDAHGYEIYNPDEDDEDSD